MRCHPATKVAQRLLKKAGIETHRVGTLALHVVCREYNERPLIIDIVCSCHEDKAKIDVCWLSDQHTMYAEVRKLHGTEFYWGEK